MGPEAGNPLRRPRLHNDEAKILTLDESVRHRVLRDRLVAVPGPRLGESKPPAPLRRTLELGRAALAPRSPMSKFGQHEVVCMGWLRQPALRRSGTET